MGPVAQSVWRLTTGWTVRGSNPGEARFSARPDRHWGPRSLLYNGDRVFPGGKVRPGRASDHSPPSSDVVLEDKSYTSTHPLGHNRACNGGSLPLTLHYWFLGKLCKTEIPYRGVSASFFSVHQATHLQSFMHRTGGPPYPRV